MNDIASKIKYALEYRNMKPKDLSEKTGISRSSISEWLSGKYDPKQDKIFLIAKALEIDEGWLLGLNVPIERKSDITSIYNKLEKERQKKVYSFAEQQLEEQNNNIVEFTKNLPIVGKSAANPSILEYGDVNVEQGSFEHIPEGADCAILIQGDSMEPLIKDGEIVFYRRQEDIENGEIAIVEINGDGVTCKKVYFNVEEETIILKSINEKYQDREISDEDIRIVGKVLLK
ncbi:hypothetical protein CKN63_03280 [Carnobacterium divergens]|uniref:LexA family transcriptional regulator n=1 Tax=Carnobacterium divergens TaxID=2748 RepID=UPI001071A6B0|nr:XRE family transcriptional regulator [Carnobacterium divergens]TFI67836.1 hypothetical protein CKN59_03240 [Carnobacterium divergens]TFI67882.1 hypothetical protein CKN76_03315 [Carnobacterium divergens]TFI82782.1 hypothetical protein CKN74_03280 [Carnobacterium divergens]TFJ08903.1 hypothetical protein CKN75_03310 [Carnobacterium divergens]TFJ14037.1 hypothetical protein CKN71_03310 [Carnobacterium divergens]